MAFWAYAQHRAGDRESRWIAGNAARPHLPLHDANPRSLLNLMAQYCLTHFDALFGALSDATRRGVLEQLARADASITALAESST